jgi:hypothetical protein
MIGFEVLDRLETSAGKDIAEVEAEGRHELASSRACDRAVLAGREAVEEGKIIELSVSTPFLNEVVVEVVHPPCIGAQENPIAYEMLAYFGDMNAVEEALKFLEFLPSHADAALGL